MKRVYRLTAQVLETELHKAETHGCQRRSESTSVGRSENASVRGAEESWFDFRQGEREGDIPLAVAASG